MLLRDKKTPGGGTGGNHKKFSQDELETIVDPVANIRRLTPAQERFDQAYAILVTGKTTRRQLYFGLPAAQKAVERARARGAHAELILVQLKVVDGPEVAL